MAPTFSKITKAQLELIVAAATITTTYSASNLNSPLKIHFGQFWIHKPRALYQN